MKHEPEFDTSEEYVNFLKQQEYQEGLAQQKSEDYIEQREMEKMMKELAEEIIAQAENARTVAGPLAVEDFAPVAEVEKWLSATENEGDAEEISKQIYAILDDRKVSAEDWVDYLMQTNVIDDPEDYASGLRTMSKSEIAQSLANQPIDVPDVGDLIDWANEN